MVLIKWKTRFFLEPRRLGLMKILPKNTSDTLPLAVARSLDPVTRTPTKAHGRGVDTKAKY